MSASRTAELLLAGPSVAMIFVWRIAAVLGGGPEPRRIDEGFGNAHLLGVGERLVQLAQSVGARADLAARNRGMALEHRERAQEMARLAAPAAPDLQVLAVDLMVRVDRRGADVGVMARDHVPAADPRQVEAFRNRGCRAGDLEDNVGAFAVGCVEDQLASFLRRR